MKILKLIPILLILFGIYPYKNFVRAEVKNTEDYKVFSSNKKKLSIANVEYYLKQGDESFERDDLENAKDSYLAARQLATKLASFYSDLNAAFIGLDARIPNEMQKKGRSTLQILAKSNSRLAALYIRNEKADVAVPLLIENIRIMSPDSKEGKEAYKALIQLGFVETTYKR